MHGRIGAAIVALTSMLASCTSLPAGPADIAQAMARIDAADMLRRIRVLASDEFEGRGPGTRGEQRTVDYLTAEFRRLGLKPGNPDGSYVQEVPFVGSLSRAELTLQAGGQRLELKEPEDFYGGSIRQVPQVDIADSELVFVGYGVVAPEYGWDDFKGVDVRGKTLVTLGNDPQVPDAADPTKLDAAMFKGRGVTSYAFSLHKREVAKQRGAAARISVFEPGLFGTATWQDRISVYGSEGFDIGAADRKLGEVGAGAEISDRAAARLFAACGLDFAALKRAAARRDFQPVPMKASASWRIRQTLRDVRSRNVVARVDGSDPALKDEVVVYTAHWDHFGRDEKKPGDQIYNGALDNASGVSAMLEVAKAFAALRTPPRRSLLFIATTGEERGLLGARYYAEHPFHPLERTLAVLNIDIANVRGPSRDLVVIGYGKSTLSDDLEQLLQARGRKAIDDPRPESGNFYRSDHVAFANRGVPAIWTLPGRDFIGKPEGWGAQRAAEYVANHYHKVSDEVGADWDLSGAVDDFRVYFELGWRVAQRERWPEWKPGDEFRARRDEMLKKSGR